MTENLRGVAAERFAARSLAGKGYEIIATNYGSRSGEIDIIALLEELIVFVEVKQRTGVRFGHAEEAVDARKLGRILATADTFIAEHPEYQDRIWRVDLVAITLDRRGVIRRVEHIENLIVD